MLGKVVRRGSPAVHNPLLNNIHGDEGGTSKSSGEVIVHIARHSGNPMLVKTLTLDTLSCQASIKDIAAVDHLKEKVRLWGMGRVLRRCKVGTDTEATVRGRAQVS
jgi:hypothetical protein